VLLVDYGQPEARKHAGLLQQRVGADYKERRLRLHLQRSARASARAQAARD
jgi:hypothetical protein